MATIKKVCIEANIDSKFKIKSNIRNHVVYIDQPKESGGEDTGPTPLEYLLFSLAGCIASIGRIMANQKKIDLKSMEVKVEGQLDVETFLGKSQENRAGFKDIKVMVKIDAPLSLEEKRQFLHEIDIRCPVSDNIENQTPIAMRVEE